MGAPATGGASCLQTCGLDYKASNVFFPSATAKDTDPALGLMPLVPTDQQVGRRWEGGKGGCQI